MRTAVYAVLLLLIGGCRMSDDGIPGSGPPATEELSYSGFRVDSIWGEIILDSTRVEMPRDVEIFGQSLFVLERYGDPVLRVFETLTWREEARFGRKGEGPAEAISPWQIVLDSEGSPWVYDSSLRRLTRFFQHERGPDGGILAATEAITFQSATPILSMGWLSDSVLIASGMFANERFGLLNTKGILVDEIGQEPPGSPDVLVHYRNQINEGAFAIHQSGDMFAIGIKHAGRLEIYSDDGTLRAMAQTPFQFEPGFTIVDSNGRVGLTTGLDLRFGYIDVAATRDRIYGLFSGRSRTSSPSSAHFGQYIHVFDWTGRLHRIIWLNAPVIGIAVDEVGSTIYGVDLGIHPSVRRFSGIDSARTR